MAVGGFWEEGGIFWGDCCWLCAFAFSFGAAGEPPPRAGGRLCAQRGGGKARVCVQLRRAFCERGMHNA